jgi:hypothetical protein
MDFGTFERFWRWLSQTWLNAQEEAPIQAILAHALREARTCVICKLLQERAFELISRWEYALAEDPGAQGGFLQCQT